MKLSNVVITYLIRKSEREQVKARIRANDQPLKVPSGLTITNLEPRDIPGDKEFERLRVEYTSV